MKLVTFLTSAGSRHIGGLTADLQSIVDFTAVDPSPVFADMLGLIDAGTGGLEAARRLLAEAKHVVPLHTVKLLSPIPEPRQIRDCFVFEKHVMQAREQSLRRIKSKAPDLEAQIEKARADGKFKPAPIWYKQPLYYKANRFSVIGSGENILWPRYANLLDYELEFGVVIGRKGKDIPKDKWADYVFGYMIFNDVSARDAQADEMPGMLGPAKGKDFDTGNVLGPWLVTADEIPDPHNLTMVARVNGEEWSRGSSRDMHHKWGDILAHVSMGETLHPGEYIATGTVGSGSGLENGKYLQPGDVIELEVEGLGVLRNRIVKS
jgi:2-keto-4-pentenoate hydratase/2-oxohepta-3-ene-1,7-dioic acid hydratase in catechol pathway